MTIIGRPSKNFVVPESQLNKNPQAVVDTNSDLLAGFVTAVKNNTQIMALTYLSKMMVLLDDQLTEIKKENAELRKLVEESRAGKTTTRKAAVAGEGGPVDSE